MDHFLLEVDGEVVSQLSEVGGLDFEPAVAGVQQQLSSSHHSLREAFSRPDRSGEITLKRLAPLDATQDALWKWFETVRSEGLSVSSRNKQRKNGSVVMCDPTLKEIARWNFYNAWPSKIENDPFTVEGNDPIRETITVQYEKLERTK